jgi:hypothetical protein
MASGKINGVHIKTTGFRLSDKSPFSFDLYYFYQLNPPTSLLNRLSRESLTAVYLTRKLPVPVITESRKSEKVRLFNEVQYRIPRSKETVSRAISNILDETSSFEYLVFIEISNTAGVT